MPVAKNPERSDAQRRAALKYQAKTQATLGVKLTRAEADAFRDYATSQGGTVSGLLADYVRACIAAEQPRQIDPATT